MSLLVLAPKVQIVPLDENKIILFKKHAKSAKLSIEPYKHEIFANLLVSGFKKEDLSFLLEKPQNIIDNLIQILLEHKILSFKSESHVLPKYRRLEAYLENSQLENLQNSSVLLLGVGGLGSYIFEHLVANGIKNITVLDDDIVEESNLSRQTLYSDEDVGSLKVEVAAAYAHKHGINIRALACRIKSVDDILKIIKDNKFDLIISTIDEPIWQVTKYVINAAKLVNIPVLRANSRAVGPFYFPYKSACPLCKSFYNAQNIPNAKSIMQRYNNGFPARKTCAVSYELAYVSLIVIKETINFLAKTGQEISSLNKELTWNAQELSIIAHDVVSCNNCIACGDACE
jgi:hypothetical protein